MPDDLLPVYLRVFASDSGFHCAVSHSPKLLRHMLQALRGDA